MTREERLNKHIDTLKDMREALLQSDNWEKLKPEIEALTTAGMALSASIENGYFVSMKKIEDIKAKIASERDNDYHHVRCYYNHCLQIIDDCLGKKENK